MALVQAVALTDAFAAHPHDPVARAIAYEAACGEQTEPWYRISVQTDRARMARMARDAAGRPTGSDDGGVGPIDQLMQLGGDDPLLGRAILKAVNLLATPQQLMQDPVLLARVMELAAAKANAAPAAARPNRWARQGPTRQELLDLTAA